MTPVPPEILEIIDAARDSGSTVRLRVVTTPGESVSGEAVGPAASVVGGELDGRYTGSAPVLDLGGGVRVTGGAYTRSLSADALVPAASPWSSPMPWIGLACLVAAGALRYYGLRRLAGYAAVLGLGLVGIAYYPAASLMIAGIVVVAALWPVLRADLSYRRRTGSLAAVLAAVESMPPETSDAVKRAVAEKADRPYIRDEIRSVKKQAGIGKYQGRKAG